MATLSSRAKFHDAFYRLVGTTTSDAALREQGEAADEVADLCLTHGLWAAQRFLIDNGYHGWVTRSDALSWTGTDAANGGRYYALSSLATAFLRLAGDSDRSSMVEANGDPWGQEVGYEQRTMTGDGYYLKNNQLWLLREAQVPSPAYLEYHAQHEEFSSTLLEADIDFPADVRMLIVAYGAETAKDEAWLPIADKNAVREAVQTWERLARDYARRSKAPRHMRQRPRLGNHYY